MHQKSEPVRDTFSIAFDMECTLGDAEAAMQALMLIGNDLAEIPDPVMAKMKAAEVCNSTMYLHACLSRHIKQLRAEFNEMFHAAQASRKAAGIAGWQSPMPPGSSR
jgi:hypothetical protein